MKNVPEIPTSEMMHAGYVRLQQPDLKGNAIACYECGEIYKAMIGTPAVGNRSISEFNHSSGLIKYLSERGQDKFVDYIAALQSRLAASEGDAERYRAKRHAAWESHTREQSAVQNTPQLQRVFYASYDAAIDAARARDAGRER